VGEICASKKRYIESSIRAKKHSMTAREVKSELRGEHHPPAKPEFSPLQMECL